MGSRKAKSERMRRVRVIWIVAAILASGNPVLAAAESKPLTTQDPASAQPTLPKPMPDLTVPTGPTGASTKKAGTSIGTHIVRQRTRRRHRVTGYRNAVERPALANVELTERLPYPPQPPHVTVPTPAYPLENLVLGLITPPPPVVCAPTRRDRFQPDPHLVDERTVLCTADNP